MPVEIVNGVPAIEINGVRRMLAASKPDPVLRASFKSFSEVRVKVDRNDWVERDFSYLGSPIRDQSVRGSCSGHASVSAFDVGRRIAGMPNVLLSCTFPYAQLNGGVDNGASVSANMDILKNLGTCTAASCGVDQIFKKQIGPEAYKEAGTYRLQEAYTCRTFDEFGAAITLGYPCAIGILIGQNFSRLDRNGIAPLPDVTVGGHAMAVVGLKKLDGQWLLKLQNSWTASFGMDGYCYITERHTFRMLDGFALVIPKESVATGDDEPPVVPSKSVSVTVHIDDEADAPPAVPEEPKLAAKPAELPKTPSLEELMADKRDRIANFRNKKPTTTDEAP